MSGSTPTGVGTIPINDKQWFQKSHREEELHSYLFAPLRWNMSCHIDNVHVGQFYSGLI